MVVSDTLSSNPGPATHSAYLSEAQFSLLQNGEKTNLMAGLLNELST